MKLSQTLISLTIASLLAACGGGGGGGGYDEGKPSNSGVWERFEDDNGNRSFSHVIYNNNEILISVGKDLISTTDEGETFKLLDSNQPLYTPHRINCASNSGDIFYEDAIASNLDFENKIPYNKTPTISDLDKTGIKLLDLNDDGIINQSDLEKSRSLRSRTGLSVVTINCNNHPMFGIDAYDYNSRELSENLVWEVKRSWAVISYDQGRTWFRSNSFPAEAVAPWKFQLTVDDDGGMYLPTTTGLARSSNGIDWTLIQLGEEIASMINSPQTQNHLLAISKTGKLYESFNNGSDWDVSGQIAEDEGGFIKTPLSLSMVTDYSPLLAVANDGEIIVSGHVESETKSLRIYRSFDNGNTWDALSAQGVSTPYGLFVTDNYYWSVYRDFSPQFTLTRIARR